MSKRLVFVCVKKDIIQPINFSLKELDKLIIVKYFDTTKQLGMTLADKQNCNVLILDSVMADESTLGFARELKKDLPALKILLIASSGTTKQELVAIIQEKTASGVLVRPFTGEQVSDYMYKLCGLQKPSETPWYMQTGMK
ncbi:MAG: hypothetical protein EPN22_11270 [Nitrospirae bacterium]|nr:MAG: hypothetical protein EPN22_11270 [Nitrospirota bacterium]